MTRTLFGDNNDNTLRAVKTKRRFWFDYWESWEIRGNDGDDYIVGGDKKDTLYGNDGSDTILGKGGNDVIYGDNYGDVGNDHLYGMDGDDSLHGGAGDDHLYGGNDNDFLSGGIGADTLEGGSGNDYYVVHANDDGVFEDTIIENDRGGRDTLETSAKTSFLAANVEKLVMKWTPLTRAVAIGNNLNNQMEGWHGHDHLLGLDGNDGLTGGLGNDTLNGGKGVDQLTAYGGGSREFDVMRGGEDADFFYLGKRQGNSSTMFYVGEGHAIIKDFDAREGDRLMMAGSKGLYNQRPVGQDTHILRGNDLIGVLEGVDSFSLSADVSYQ